MAWKPLNSVGVSAPGVKPHLPDLKESRAINKGLQGGERGHSEVSSFYSQYCFLFHVGSHPDSHMMERKPGNAKLCGWLPSHSQSRGSQAVACKGRLQGSLPGLQLPWVSDPSLTFFLVRCLRPPHPQALRLLTGICPYNLVVMSPAGKFLIRSHCVSRPFGKDGAASDVPSEVNKPSVPPLCESRWLPR